MSCLVLSCLDVGRDDGLGSQWVGVARVFRSR